MINYLPEELLFNTNLPLDENLLKYFLILVGINFGYGCLSLILGFDKKIWSRIIGSMLALCLVLFFVYIAYFNSWCYDYDSYVRIYNSQTFAKDPGYQWIQSIFYNAGFTYAQFRTILYATAYLFVWIFLSAFKINKNFTLALYAFFPWGANMILTRDFVGFSLVLLASTFLLLKKWWKIIGIPAFIGLIYCAYTIQGSMIIYGIFILIFFSIKERNVLVPAAALAGLGVAFGEMTGLNTVDEILALLPEKVEEFRREYATTSLVFREKNVLLMITVLTALVILICRLNYRKKEVIQDSSFTRTITFDRKNKQDEDDQHSLNILLLMSLCMFVVMPLYTKIIHLMRFPRDFSIVMYGALSISMRDMLKKKNWSVLLAILIMLFAMKYFISFLDTFEDMDHYFYVFFTGEEIHF